MSQRRVGVRADENARVLTDGRGEGVSGLGYLGTVNATGIVKLMDPCVISGGNAGNGEAWRIIAVAWASSAATPDDPASRLPVTCPLRLSVKDNLATPGCRLAAAGY